MISLSHIDLLNFFLLMRVDAIWGVVDYLSVLFDIISPKMFNFQGVCEETQQEIQRN